MQITHMYLSQKFTFFSIATACPSYGARGEPSRRPRSLLRREDRQSYGVAFAQILTGAAVS